jgi:hypothetical protein
MLVAGIVIAMIGGGVLANEQTKNTAFAILLIIIGIVLAVVAMIMIKSTLKGAVGTADLKRLGQKCEGVIIEIVPEFSIAINENHPFVARCHVVDSITGETSVVKSDPYFNDISGFVGQEVDVYIDELDRTKYFVDVEKLINEKPYLVGKLQAYDYEKR